MHNRHNAHRASRLMLPDRGFFISLFYTDFIISISPLAGPGVLQIHSNDDNKKKKNGSLISAMTDAHALQYCTLYNYFWLMSLSLAQLEVQDRLSCLPGTHLSLYREILKYI